MINQDFDCLLDTEIFTGQAILSIERFCRKVQMNFLTDMFTMNKLYKIFLDSRFSLVVLYAANILFDCINEKINQNV